MTEMIWKEKNIFYVQNKERKVFSDDEWFDSLKGFWIKSEKTELS